MNDFLIENNIYKPSQARKAGNKMKYICQTILSKLNKWSLTIVPKYIDMWLCNNYDIFTSLLFFILKKYICLCICNKQTNLVTVNGNIINIKITSCRRKQF